MSQGTPDGEVDEPEDPSDDSSSGSGDDSPFRDRPPIDEARALDLLARGELDVLGRMPWSSNGTFLCDVSDIDGDGAGGPDADSSDATQDSTATGDGSNDRGDTDAATRGNETKTEVVAQAIYKPHAGEQPLWDFPSGLYKREVACFELSRALGWDLVPPTVLRDGQLGPGSVQLFVPCDFEDHYFTLQDDPELRHVFERLTAFDFIANSTDRKSGHVLLGKDSRIHAIDNGLSFHVEFKLRTVLWDFADEPIPQDIIDDMAAFLADGPPDELTSLLNTLEVDAMLTRTRALISKGTFPTDPTGRRWPWPLV